MPRFRVRKADSMDTAAEVLQLAQQAAEQAIADAQREAEEIRARARQEAEQIIADAKARAERLLGPWSRHSVMPPAGCRSSRQIASERIGEGLHLGPGFHGNDDAGIPVAVDAGGDLEPEPDMPAVGPGRFDLQLMLEALPGPRTAPAAEAAG